MPQNTTKNILISVALIAFIVSSGAFTIYQLAKRQTNTTNDSQTSLQSSSFARIGFSSSVSDNSKLNTNSLTNELIVKFDPYICGFSITGLVDQPDILQKLEVVLTNKDKAETTQSFNPKIDEAKNFKLLLDQKLITDGIYKLEAKATLNNQKSETTETTIEFKKDCTSLIQNSTPANQILAVSSLSELSSSSQTEIKNENSIQANSTIEQSSQVTTSSELPRQIVDAPPLTQASSSAISSSIVDNSNNPNSVRTGGLDITTIFMILVIALSSSLFYRTRVVNLSIKDIFGNK